MSIWRDFRIEIFSISGFITSMIHGDLSTQRSPKPISILREQTKLVIEVCQFTQDLNPLWQTRSSLERLKSLSHPILEKLKSEQTQQNQFDSLVHSFFEDLGFQIRQKSESLQTCFLPQVLSSKEGPAPLLMLLFASLAEESGIKVQVTSCRLRYLMKVHLDGRTHVVDFAQKCKALEPYELVELINKGFDFSNGTLCSDILVVEYLNELRSMARLEKRLQILSLVHSYLMRYQPFNLRHLSERAVVAYETGDYRTAVDDIRSYFLYKQPEFNNIDLKRIYKMALKRVRNLES